MKYKYIVSGLLAAALMATSCAEVDEINHLDGVGTSQLTVKGLLVEGSTAEYPSVIDAENGLITVQVPYYISDTDPIMGDLTQMKLEAQMPVGYKFSPSISGIHDLTQGFQTNLIDDKGCAHPFTIVADYVKSSAAKITSALLVESPRTTIVVNEPVAPGENGSIVIYKTSSSLDGALHAATIEVSPWATFECPAYDPATGMIDMSGNPSITVTAQDGVTKVTYDIMVDLPKLLESGIGYIANMWGFQTTVDDPHGFEAGANTSLAVVGDYLIVANRLDVTKMLVFDRFNGELLENVRVNTTGMPTDREYRAICNDDASHLIAATFTSTVDATATASTDVRIFVWKDGIQNPPTSILWANMLGGYFKNAPYGINNATKLHLFSTIACCGDITSGDAVIGTTSPQPIRCVFLEFTDGKPSQPTAYVEWGGGKYASMWNASKAVPITKNRPLGYLWDSGNARLGMVFTPVGTGNRAISFEAPKSHFWWGDASKPDWSKSVRSIAYCEFNGAHLVATTNGTNNGGFAHRLYVANVGANPTVTSMTDGFIFDSREGNSLGDASKGGPIGTGYGPTGMTSVFPYVSGTSIIGPNTLEMNDVIFGRSSDGNAVQVYMLVGDQGLIAYEMTRFDI